MAAGRAQRQHEVVESAAYYDQALRPGNFDVAMDFQCGYIVEPDLDLYKFVSTDKNPSNYGQYTDRTLDELFEKQTRATDPEERKKYVRAFEKRLLDEEVHYLMTLQWHRHHPAFGQGEGLADHPQPLFEQHPRRGVVDRIGALSRPGPGVP